MTEKVLLDKDFVTVSYISDLKLGKVVWKRKPLSSEYKMAFLTLLNHASAEDVFNFMSDIRRQGIIAPDDRKWFEKEMLPAAIKAGLQRASVIFDGNVFKKYYINLIVGASNKFGLPLRVFLSEEEALGWISSFMNKDVDV